MYSSFYTEQESLCLDTKWLKEHDYFCGYKSGGIMWTYGFDCRSSISIKVDVDASHIQFIYTIEKGTNEERQMDYIFPLVKVPCNLGGFRWAFKCGLTKESRLCGRTVYTLYKPPNSDYFGCIKCMHIVYESQRDCGNRLEFFGKMLKAEDKYSKIYDSIHKWHYQGKPTRKIKKLYDLKRKLFF